MINATMRQRNKHISLYWRTKIIFCINIEYIYIYYWKTTYLCFRICENSLFIIDMSYLVCKGPQIYGSKTLPASQWSRGFSLEVKGGYSYPCSATIANFFDTQKGLRSGEKLPQLLYSISYGLYWKPFTLVINCCEVHSVPRTLC